MSKSPRKTLEQLFLDAIADGGTGGSMEDVVSKAAAELKEAVLAKVGQNMKEYHPKAPFHRDGVRMSPRGENQRIRTENNLRDEIRKAILTMFEGE